MTLPTCKGPPGPLSTWIIGFAFVAWRRLFQATEFSSHYLHYMIITNEVGVHDSVWLSIVVIELLCTWIFVVPGSGYPAR